MVLSGICENVVIDFVNNVGVIKDGIAIFLDQFLKRIIRIFAFYVIMN